MAPKLSSFLRELKRRRVYRAATVYVVVGAGIIGLGEAALPSQVWGGIQIPIGVLLLAGLPIALVLAWAYELKPEEARLPDPAGVESPASAADRMRDGEAEWRNRKSIVVLPFDNVSPDPADAYLADGLTEEIITNLSFIRSLRVISRSSALVLKGTQKDVRTIGQELAVQYVLEGSVRKVGSDLRITAQLIDAASDSHLWAEKYDGVLEDVFGMQDEVSRSIVEALELRLLTNERDRVGTRRPGNLQAYELFLRARSEVWGSLDESSLTKALELAERGLALAGDSDLLLALKGLVYFQFVNAMIKPPQTYESLLAQAQDCADRAVELNPESAAGHALQGFVSMNRGNPAAAVVHFREALLLNPGDPDTLMFLGFLGSAGGWAPEGTVALLERLARVDPLTPVNKGGMAWFHWFHEGDFGAAIQSWSGWFGLLEEAKSPWRFLHAYLTAAAGRPSEANAIVERMRRENPDHLLTALGVFLRHAWMGEVEEALGAVTDDLEQGARWDDFWPVVMADGYAMINERDSALHWLERGIEYGITHVKYLQEYDPFLANLRADDRFHTLMTRASELTRSLSALARLEQTR
jgi:TolB-like protein